MSYLTRAREIAGLTLYEVPRHVPVSVVRLAHYEEGLDEAPAELLRAMLDCPRFEASRPALALHLLLSTMTARQVAQRLGCFDTDVSRWRTGRRLRSRSAVMTCRCPRTRWSPLRCEGSGVGPRLTGMAPDPTILDPTRERITIAGHAVELYPGEDGMVCAAAVSIPGCFSQGADRPSAIANITEAIAVSVAPLPPPSEWFIANYEIRGVWLGLLAGDGVERGVPEGSPEEWRRLLLAMRAGREFRLKRLSFLPGRGIGRGRVVLFPTTDAEFVRGLLSAPRPWREDGKRGE